jgi:hypothetical protein
MSSTSGGACERVSPQNVKSQNPNLLSFSMQNKSQCSAGTKTAMISYSIIISKIDM